MEDVTLSGDFTDYMCYFASRCRVETLMAH